MLRSSQVHLAKGWRRTVTATASATPSRAINSAAAARSTVSSSSRGLKSYSSSSSNTVSRPPQSPLSSVRSYKLQPSLLARTTASFHTSTSSWAPETIKVPQMAESISEGTLKTWLKKPGDWVKADEEIASIETDKIDVAINAPKAGKIVEVLAQEEDTVAVGQDLYKLEPGEPGEGEQSSGSQEQEKSSEPEQQQEESSPKEEESSKAEESAPAPSGEAETIKVPQMAESISEGTLKTWNKKVGDYVEADEEIASIETDKIDVSINAPKAGTIVEILAKEDEVVSVGQDLYKLAPGGSKPSGDGGKGRAESQDEGKSAAQVPSQGKDASQNPSAKGGRKTSLSEVPNKEAEPSRPEPKASKDVQQPKPQQSKKDDSSKGEQQSSKPAPGNRTERRVKMNSMRKRIAERLKQSQNAAASLTTFNEIDMSSLMSMRSQYKDQILKNHGIKFGFMSAFAKASALALQEIPAANASIEGAGPGDQIVYRDYVDLSVAVATPKGLVTPIVRNVEAMSMLEIEKAIADLGKKARDNKLTLEDMTGGTFTISNGGVFGSLYGTPIINLPQAAVLGMHSIKDRATVVDGKIEIRPIMVVALTYDHRLLDGREAVTFLVRVKQYIEDPRFMLLA